MIGEYDPIYIAARRALLDALDALADQREAFVLVGAQAIYLHTGEGDVAVAPYTTDADLALDPRVLADTPLLEGILRQAGIQLGAQPGAWLVPVDGRLVPLDLMVPDALDPQGKRAARLGLHGDRTVRRATGLEAALVDRCRQHIGALDPADTRAHEVWVAGPGALIVAKLHKIGERIGHDGRQKDKDALDILRLLRATTTEALGERLVALHRDPLAGPTTTEAIALLRTYFTAPDAEGCQMAARAVSPLEDEAEIAGSCAFLGDDLSAFLQKVGI